MDWDVYFRFLLALVFVVALIGLVAWLARRYGVGGTLPRASGGRRRLRIVETAAVDAKRRLVLLRRDDVEHLVLLGPGSETVIETRIAPPADLSGGEAAADAGPASDSPGGGA